MKNGNNFCRDKYVCLIQIFDHKLFSQRYFLVEVKKKLLHCRIAMNRKEKKDLTKALKLNVQMSLMNQLAQTIEEQ